MEPDAELAGAEASKAAESVGTGAIVCVVSRSGCGRKERGAVRMSVEMEMTLAGREGLATRSNRGIQGRVESRSQTARVGTSVATIFSSFKCLVSCSGDDSLKDKASHFRSRQVRHASSEEGGESFQVSGRAARSG